MIQGAILSPRRVCGGGLSTKPCKLRDASDNAHGSVHFAYRVVSIRFVRRAS